jgi:hypothetical protein
MIKKEKKNEPIELTLNPKLSTFWIDSVNISIREDHLCLIRLLINLPEGVFEQSRMMITKENLKKTIDMLCFALDYDPNPDKTDG